MMKLCLPLLFLAAGEVLSQGIFPSEPTGINSKETCLCAQGFCEPGWVQYKNACYKKFKESVSWPVAEATCLQHDSHLASIHSYEENDFVFALMGRPNRPYSGEAYWFGGHDVFDEGNYMNSDGSRMTITPFGKGQPDNLGEEDYLGSWVIENGHITWNDYPLTPYTYPFVCKYYLGNRLCKRDDVSYGY